jgi:MFS family permease
MGSALSFLAVFMPFADCISEENYYRLSLRFGITDEQGIFYSETTISIALSLGLISGIGGAIAFAISSSASCRTFPERFLKLLGGWYLVLAVTSILMLVALASFTAQCNVLLVWGGAFAIVAFFLYLGAGIFTIGMIKKKDVNRASVCTCCPYGNLTALPSVFGFIGSSMIMTSSIISSPAGTTGDPKLTFSLTMGVIASAVGLMVSVLGIVPGCQKVPSRDFKILGFTYILLGLMCLLTLLAYDIVFSVIFSIPAFVAFTVAGFSAFYLVKVSSQAHTSDSAV